MSHASKHSSTDRQVKLAFLGYFGVCLIWGTTYLAIKIGVRSMSPWLLAGVRFLMAGAVLLVAARLAGQRLPRAGEWWRLAVVGVLLLCVSNGCVVWAMQYVDSGLGALIIAMLPIFTLGWLTLLGQRPSARCFVGVLIGFAGIGIVLWPHQRAAAAHAEHFVPAVAALFMAPVSWSLGSIYAQRRTVDVPPLMRVAIQSLVGGLVMTALGVITSAGSASGGFSPTWQSWLALAYLVVFGSIIGYGSYIYAIEHLSATLVSTYTYINPVVALSLGILCAGEHFDRWILIGSAVMLVGVIIVNRAMSRARGAATVLTRSVDDVPSAGDVDPTLALCGAADGPPAAPSTVASHGAG